MPTPINCSEEFEAALKSAQDEGKTVIAKFGASWCAPCKKVAPFYKAYSEQFTDMVFLDVDYDAGDIEELADDWNVDKIPMFIVIKDGKEQGRLQNSDETKLHALISEQFKDVAQEQIADAFSMDAEF